MRYEYVYEMPAEAETTLAIFLVGFLLLFLGVMLAIAVVFYLLEAIGMSTIAKRRGIHRPWLAWIPIASVYLLGSISDQYQYVVKGRVRSRRKILLGLSIAMLAVSLLWIPTMGVLPIFISMGMDITFEAAAGLVTIFGLLFLLVFMALGITMAVFEYMALYDLYLSCDPGNAVLYLVLSILFSVTMPFFLFFSRNKDLGMPPRKDAETPQQTPPQLRQPPVEIPPET